MTSSTNVREPSAVRCFGVVLAAGRSRRFGSDKRLHKLSDGQPLAISTLRQWSTAVSDDGLTELFVVTRGAPSSGKDYLDPLATQIAETDMVLTVIAAEDAHLGMGHSLAAAMPHVPPGPIIVGLADMPFVQPATLKQIAKCLRTFNSRAIVRPSYNGQPGNPLGFGDAWRSELALSTGDTGARTLVKQAANNGTIIDLPVDDRGVLQDIDRASDL